MQIEINLSDSIAYVDGQPHRLVSSGNGSRGRVYDIGEATGAAPVVEPPVVEVPAAEEAPPAADQDNVAAIG
jgi:hypothetical protein